MIGDVSEENNRVALVDHNEVQQSATGVEKVEVEYVVDHHRIANFQTANPLFYRDRTSRMYNTILYKMYKEYGVDDSKRYCWINGLSYCIRHINYQNHQHAHNKISKQQQT